MTLLLKEPGGGGRNRPQNQQKENIQLEQKKVKWGLKRQYVRLMRPGAGSLEKINQTDKPQPD